MKLLSWLSWMVSWLQGFMAGLPEFVRFGISDWVGCWTISPERQFKAEFSAGA